MKRIPNLRGITALLIGLLWLASSAQARFSQHVRVTPENDDHYHFHLAFEKFDTTQTHVTLTMPVIADQVWLFVCRNPLSPEQQEFRGYVWGGAKQWRGPDIVEEKVLSDVNAWKAYHASGKNEMTITIPIETKKLPQAYIYIDYPEEIADGGFYYTVDLGAYQ